MVRLLSIVLSSLFAAALAASGTAGAAQAGRVVLSAGDASMGGKPVTNGQAVQEGDEIATGPGGYLYVKTIDNGFLILRPNSRARIVSYHIEAGRPADTRIKLELLGGVARHISGEAVKQSRQNFRFNTPVAAIGVRGTDFTVFTDQNTSRVAVISGGIVVSGFSVSCGRDGSGPCEDIASRELFAAQSGQILQVRRGQAVPQLLPITGLSPDLIAPPRVDEPAAKPAPSSGSTNAPATGASVGPTGTAGPTTTAATGVSLDPKKSSNLQLQQVPTPPPVVTPAVPPVVIVPVEPPPVIVAPPVVVPPVVITPPVIVPPVVVVPPPVVVEPAKQILWGRWQAVLDNPANLDFVKEVAAKGELISINKYFALVRTAGRDWELPTGGTIGLALKQSEAYILDEPTRLLTPAQLANGKLQIDFGKASFATSFDLASKSERFQFQAQGGLTRDGQLQGNNQFAVPTNMTVNGLFNPENGGTAAYIFQGRIDNSRLATGVTAWGK